MATAGTSNYALDQLNELLQDEVLNILQTYFELKIVQIEAGTLVFFLHKRLHELFHYFTKQACCSTTTPCEAVKIKGSLTKDQFFLLFENDPSVQPIHEKKEKGRITLHCICPLSPNRSTKILALDFTLINCLIKTSHQTPPAGNPQWITEIMRIRNLLSHKGDASTVTDLQIEEWGKRLEDAAMNIAGTVGESYQGGVKRRIDRMKKRQSELDEMMKALKTRDDDFEQKIINALKNLGIQAGGVPFQITNTEFLKEEPQISLATPVKSSVKDPHKCIVVWTFSSPGDWDVEKMQQKLEQMNRLGDFDIQFVYRGSLVIHTQADPAILSIAERFKESIEEFLFLFANLLQMKAPKADSFAIAIAIWHEQKEEDVKEDDSMPRKPVDEGDRKIGLDLSKSEDKCRRKTVTKLLEEDDQTSSTITKEEADFQKETTQEVMKEETQTTSALQAEDTTHAQAPVNKSQLPRKLKRIKQIDMSGEFTDCTAVDDTFVICDYNNNRLVVTDSDGSNVRDIPLSGRPWRVTAIDNTTVAVIIGNRDIDIINIYSGDRIRRISVDDYVRGLTYSEPHLYIRVEGKGIQVCDLHGNTIKTIPIERNVYRMTINNQSIFYSDYNTISCVKPSGERMWTVGDPMVIDIKGLTTDDTNIYVICNDSHAMFVISPDGKQVRQLLSETDGLEYPRGICYNEKLKTLMVCNRDGPAYFFNIVK